MSFFESLFAFFDKRRYATTAPAVPDAPEAFAAPVAAAQLPAIRTPADFIAAIGPAARESMAKTKIPASFTIAQAALESSWGAHAPGMNLFGIKADTSWHGSFTTQLTHEVVGGKTIEITAKFRAYTDWLGSILDHAQFFIVNKRYLPAFQCTTGAAWADAVARAGYATDPQYAAKLKSIIKAHQLDALDREAA